MPVHPWCCPEVSAKMGCGMSRRSIVCRVGVLLSGASLAVACQASDDGGGGTGAATSVQIATDVPSGYDACSDVPQEVLDSENLKMPIPQNSTVSGGIKWRGCTWVQSDGYAATIQTTNITVEMVLEKGFPDTRRMEIAGRSAVSSRRVDDHPGAACALNIDMAGGSLEINLSNPPSRKKTGHLDTCELTVELAEKIVPTLPEGV